MLSHPLDCALAHSHLDAMQEESTVAGAPSSIAGIVVNPVIARTTVEYYSTLGNADLSDKDCSPYAITTDLIRYKPWDRLRLRYD